jgi:hypothetical protein
VLVEIGYRSVFGNTAVGGRVASGGGSAHDLTLLVPAEGGVGRGAWGVERGAREEWSVASESKGKEPEVIEKRQNKAKLLGC